MVARADARRGSKRCRACWGAICLLSSSLQFTCKAEQARLQDLGQLLADLGVSLHLRGVPWEKLPWCQHPGGSSLESTCAAGVASVRQLLAVPAVSKRPKAWHGMIGPSKRDYIPFPAVSLFFHNPVNWQPPCHLDWSQFCSAAHNILHSTAEEVGR